jgi:hypothetical protein
MYAVLHILVNKADKYSFLMSDLDRERARIENEEL